MEVQRPMNLFRENLPYVIIGSFIVLFFRYFLTKFVFIPVGLWFGLKDFKTKRPPVHPVLEQAYRKSKNWTSEEILGLSKQLDMSEDEVKDWLYLKSSQNKATVLTKFVECYWKFSYYSFEMACGMVVLLNKSWFWDISECWNDLHSHVPTSDLWWYCTLCGSYAWSQLFHIVYDVKKKDFFVMFTHHLVVVLIYILALRSNMFRVGACAVFISNIPGVSLEASKMAKYLGFERLALLGSILFTITWLVVRLALQPFWQIKSYFVYVPKMVPPIFPDFIYNGLGSLLVLFFCLNCIWTYFLIKGAIGFLLTGRRQDPRSDSDN